jgi:CRP/FNR family transcriptional regulator
MYSPELLPSTREASLPPFPFGSVSPSLESLFGSQVGESFEPGQAVFWEGDAAGHVFHLLEGCMRVFRTLPEGRRAIIGFIYPGDLLGVSFRERYLFTAEAVSPVRLRRFPRRRFHQLVDEAPNLRPQLLAKICDEMTAAQDQMILLGRKSAEERVVTFLLTIARRSGADTRTPVAVELRVGRLDMADYLGLTIETVSREFSKLRRDGLISLNGPHNVVLRRMRSLQEIAGVDEDDPLPAQAGEQPVWAN